MSKYLKFVEWEKADVYLIQTLSLVKGLTEDEIKKSIMRLGGNLVMEFSQDKIELLKNVLCVIATNKKLYDFAKQYNKNVFLIPNGLDLSEWKYCYKKQEKFTVGFCGNILNYFYANYKGYYLFEEACSRLNVEKKFVGYKINQIDHSLMRECFYSKISCLLHPTLGEGCSNTIMEALACGVPVITTKTAGFHGELLEDGKNVLFCERDIKSIMGKLLLLKENEKLALKLSRNGRKFAEKHHDIRKIVSMYRKVFEYIDSECFNKI